MRSAIICTLSVLAVLCSATTGFTQATAYKVGVEELDYLPYYGHQNKEYTGFAREVLDTFAASQGIKLTYRILPVKRLFSSFLDGKVDFKFPDNPYWQADMKKGHEVHYSQPVVDYIDGVMVLPQKKGMGVDDLKVLGTVRGFTAWDYLDRINAKTLKISENDSFPGLLKQTIKGRVDGAYINPVVARFQLENNLKQPNALVFDPNLPHTKSAYLLSSKKYPEIIEALNQFLKSNKAAVDALKKKHNVNF